MYALILGLLLLVLTITSVFLQRSPDIQPSSRVLRTSNFILTYQADISKQKVEQFAAGLEAAYKHLVVREKLHDGVHKWTLKGPFLSVTYQCLPTIAAHEFFHSMQLQYPLKLADRFLLEGTATWAMREVFPESAECYQETLEDWLVGGTDYSSVKLLSRGYQGGLFWNYLAERYGGAQLIRRLFEHPDIRLGIDWPKVLSILTGKSFLDLWDEFAVALATHQVPDAAQLFPLAEQKTNYVPVPVYGGEWTGQLLTIDQINWQNPFVEICEKKKEFCPLAHDVAVIGSPLTVRHPYGIHFLRIIPKANTPLVLQFNGSSDTDFRVYVVGSKNSTAYETSPLMPGCILSNPLDYQFLQVVITRGEKGSGSYQVKLAPLQNQNYAKCFAQNTPSEQYLKTPT
ncbi:hypothetical protein HYR54_02140 [Candidatus Acetothermia bacterium]|nr:hypothetical protein [Candidatus Acetothermia bacterium]